MLIRLFADIHLHEWSDFARVREDGLNSRLVDQVEALERLCQVPSLKFKRVPDIAIVAGDITHKRGILTPAVVHAVNRVFAEMSMRFLKTIVIPGNHDYPTKNGPSWLNSLELAKDKNGVLVINEPTILKGVNLDLREASNNLSVGFVPWMFSGEAMRQAFLSFGETLGSFRSEDPKNVSLLISHLALKGAKTDNGMSYDGGLLPEDLQPDCYNGIFLGDFHHAQSIRGNIHYIGAPYPMTRSDVNLAGAVVDIFVSPEGQFDFGYTLDPLGKRIIRTDNLKEAEEAEQRGQYVSFIASGKREVAAAQALNLAVEFVPPKGSEQRLDVKADSGIPEILDAYFASLEEGEFEGREKQAEIKALALEVYQDAEKEKAFGPLCHVKNLVLKTLVAENFLSYGRLEVDLDKQGLVLLEGVNEDDMDAESNGAGKSAVIEAVAFALFGETLRGVPVAEIPKKGVKEMSVKMLAEVDGIELTIARGRTGAKSSFIWNYDNLTAHHSNDPKEAQRELDALTGWNIDLFRQVAIFGQNAEFDFSVATDLQRKELLEKLLPDGKRFAVLANYAATTDRKINLAVADVLGQQKTAIQVSEKSHEQRVIAADRSANFEREKADDLARIDEKIKAEEQARKDSEEAANLAKAEVGKLENEKKEMLSESAIIREESLKEKVQTAKGEAQSAGLKRDQLKGEVLKLERECEDMLLQAGGDCPTCKQEVTSEYVESVVEKLKVKVEDRRKELRQAEEVLAEKTANVKKAEAELDETQIRLRVRRETLAELDSKLTLARREEDEAFRASERSDVTLQGLNNQYQEVLNRANAWNQVEKEHKEAADKAEADVKRLTEEAVELQEMKRISEQVVKLYGNQGLKTFMFDALAPTITEKANEALAILSSGALSVNLTTERRGANEKIVFTVSNNYGAPGMKGQSGGQRRKIDVALHWAIASLVEGRINVLFVDEAFDALDSVAGSRVAELLKTRQGSHETIINITHRTEFKHYFPTVWTVRLKGGSSALERNENATFGD